MTATNVSFPAPDARNTFEGGARALLARLTDPAGQWLDFGNIPDFDFDATNATIDHENTRYGVTFTDKRVSTQRQIVYNLTSDEFNEDNLQFVLAGGAITDLTQVAAPAGTLVLAAPVVSGRWYDLGKYNVNVTGATSGAVPTTLVEGTDYVLQEDAGLILFLTPIVITDAVTVTFDTPALTGRQFDVLTEDPSVTVRAKLMATGNDGRRLIWTPPKALLSFSGKIAIQNKQFNKIAAQLQIIPDFNQAKPYGSFVMLPPVAPA